MRDIMAALRDVNPEILIEFRQPYVGPLMRSYGNLFRAGDAPNSLTDNRVRVVDLRLSSGTTTVHSDMLMWHVSESVESAALQLLNVIFAVPQLSVRLAEIPEEHLDMVRYYTGYWRRNRATLLDGTFRARAPLSNYPLVSAQDEDKLIAVAYAPAAVPLGDVGSSPRIDVINATTSGRLVLDIHAELGPHTFRILDAMGSEVSSGVARLNEGAMAFEVPPAGLLELVRSRPE